MPSLTVSAIQADLIWKDKATNLAAFGRKISALKGNTELVVLPEMFSTGFCTDPEGLAETMDGPTVSWMKETARENRVILTGSLIVEEQGKFFNRLLWVQPDGRMGQYDKRHLFAFAGEADKYSAGSQRLIASVKGWKILLLICYDLRFPAWSRQMVSSPGNKEPEYDLIVYVANWPDRRRHAWKTLLQARAIENQAFVIGVNRVGRDAKDLNYEGDTMVVDALGDILISAAGREEIITVTIKKEDLETVRTKLPFWKDRDEFHIER